MKISLLSICLAAAFSSCGESDENDNGNSDEVQQFCDCAKAKETTKECQELADKMKAEYEAADEKAKEELMQSWKEKEAMCK